MFRALAIAVVVLTSSACNCASPGKNDSGTGGGFSNVGGGLGGGVSGGGSTTGGGSATGGGTATGGGSATGGGTAMDAGNDAGLDAGIDAGVLDAGTLCNFQLGPADQDRKVVVSHPFPEDGGQRDNLWEVFNLSMTGTLTATGQFFRMGRSTDPVSPIVFTPNGRLGLVAQENGTIGVFRFDENAVTVVNPGLAGNFYADKLVMQPSGNRVWVLDFNTLNNGGGVYQLDIDCNGTLFNEQYLLPGNTAQSAVVVPNQNLLVVAARSLPTTAMMQDLVVVNTASMPPVVASSITGFPDRDALAPSVSLSRDQRIVAMPDNGFSVGSRIAFFELAGNGLTFKQVVTANAGNPLAVAFSPFTDTGLVVNSDGADHYRRLTWNQALTSFTISAPLPYVNGRPQLPTAPVMITRGALNGRLLIAELDAVRQLQFETDGGITDVQKVSAGGAGNGQILGTIGVTP